MSSQEDTERDTLRAELEAARARIAELEAENAYVGAAVRGAGVGTWSWSSEKDEVHWDETMLRILGRDAAPAGYDEYFDLVHPDDAEALKAVIQDALKVGVYENFAHRLKHQDGSWRNIQARGVAIADETGAPRKLIGSCWDVTHEATLERELEASQRRLSMALEASRLGTWSHDLVTGELEWDEGMLRVYGIDKQPASGEEAMSFVHPDDRKLAVKVGETLMQTGVCLEPEFRIIAPNGELRWVLIRGRVERDAAGTPVSIYGGAIDVTRLKELEAQLRRAQRFEAVGHLTAGIAHNFNNLLMAILPNVDLAAGDVDTESAAGEALADAKEAARRAAALIRQLMVYSRRSVGVVDGSSDAAEVVTRTVDLVSQGIDRKYEIRTTVDKELPLARIDAGQLEQVVLNLVLNARDALEDVDSPRILVSVERFEDAMRRAGVRVVIEDNGRGIAPDLLERIFQPFVSTKGPELGSGLGLATVDAIVRHADGAVRVKSEEGVGTTFSVELPASEESSAGADKRLTSSSKRRRLLVVDDEPMVRRTLARILEGAGHEVIQAADGHAALDILSKEAPSLDGYLVDHWMPKLNGRDLIKHAQELGIDLPYLILSGDPGHAELREFDGPRLRKPVLRKALLDAVEALGS